MIKLLGLSILLISSFAQAQNLKLQGSGIYKFFFIKVYEAKLWTHGQANLYDGDVKLQLKYLRDLKGSDIFDQTGKELAHADHSDININKWMPTIKGIFPNVKDGDIITAYYKPSSGVEFFFNEETSIGQIKNKDFAIAFMDIWLGKKSSSQKFRKQLLGIRK